MNIGKSVRILMVLCCILALSRTGYGEEKHPIDIRMEEDVDKDMSTARMKMVGQQALSEWTREMEKYYALLLGELDDEKKLSLETAQSTWTEYVQSEDDFCDIFYGFMRGSFFDILRIEKRVELVKERALKLKFNYDLLMDEKPYEYYSTNVE